jgi:hypothetical protein
MVVRDGIDMQDQLNLEQSRTSDSSKSKYHEHDSKMFPR